MQLKNASRAAAVGTASMGKFDKRAKGEAPVSSHLGIKRRRFEPVVGNTGRETEKVTHLRIILAMVWERYRNFCRHNDVIQRKAFPKFHVSVKARGFLKGQVLQCRRQEAFGMLHFILYLDESCYGMKEYDISLDLNMV